ncbi:MAG TPA: PGPGW domain-containing protein [Actinomycetes bacterium]
MVEDLTRGAKRLAVLVVGLVLLVAGILLLVLPGPGLLVTMAGLAVLATEYEWARRLLARLRQHARRLSNQVRRR